MKDNDKTHGQLIKDLTSLHQRIAQLEGCERQRKEVEETLKRSNQEKTIILDSITELVAYQDTRMRILWVNRAAAESVGVNPQQLVGRHCYEIWPQRNRPCVGCPVVKAHKSGRPQEAEMTTPDGRVWLIRGYPVRDKKGTVTGAVEVTLEITDRKQAEESLRTERDKAQQYLDIAEVILVALNKKGTITLINKKGNQILGYREGELLGKNWFTTCVPARLRKKIKNGFLKLMAGERQLTEFYENPALTKSGTEKIMAWHNSLVKDAQGNPIGTLSSGEDITDRKQAEELLRESEDRYRSLYKNSEDAILLTAPDGRILKANPAACRMFGRTEAEITRVGRNGVIDLTDPLLPIALAERNRTGRFRGELNFRRRNGQLFPAEVTSVVFQSKDGQPRTSMIIRDITEHKRAEEALKESEKKYRQVVENATDIIYTTDINGNFTYANSIALKVTGYSLEELQRFNYLDLVVPEYRDQLKEIYGNQFRARQETTYVEFPFSNKFGEVMWFGQNASLMFEGRKIIGFQVIARDLTERKEAEEKLRENEERYKTLFDEAVVGICLADAETGIIVDCNEAMAALVGREREDLIGESQKILHPPQDDEELFSSTFKQHLTDKDGLILETQVITKAGDIREVEIKSNLLELQGRKVLQGLFHDITDRKQAEATLRESEIRFRTLFEAIPDTVLVHDDKGTILHINEIGAQQLEWSAKDLVGRNLREIVTPENAASITDHVKETRKVGWSRFETTYVSRSGWRITAEVYEHPIVFGKKNAILSVARDITKRKEAEEKLRASEEKYRDLVENINDIIYSIDKSGIVTYVAPGIESISGYTTSEIIGRPFSEFVYEEDMPYMRDAFQRDVSGQAEPHEYRMKTKAGDIRWVRTFSQPFFEGDRLVGLRGVLTDITERKQAEEELQKSEEKLKNIVENSTNLFYAHTPEHVLTYLSPQVKNILGYKPEEAMVKWTELASDNPINDEGFKLTVKAIKTGKQQPPYELELIHKNGNKVWVEVREAPVVVNNKTILIVGALTDITERKQAEEALLGEKIFSDTVMDSSPGLFFVFDDQGKFLRWNKNVEKFTEYSAQEISKMKVLDFVVQEDKKSAAEAMQQVLNKGQASVEINVLSKSGKKIPFYLTGLRTNIENITCVVGSGFDITDIKEAEEALHRSYDQLQETFISSINALASTVEMKDQYTAGHQPRVTQLACAIADEMGLSKNQIEGIRMAGLIHDIGKIVVPAEILNKPGPLTEVQYEMIKMHPQAGYDILRRIAFPWPVAQIVQQHHEMMDGSGYPQGLAGEDILPEARIMAVANVVEAMTAHRPYRPAYDIEEALAEILHNRGIKYDPTVVDACLRLFTERGFVFDSAQ